jgi:hypothetical protein
MDRNLHLDPHGPKLEPDSRHHSSGARPFPSKVQAQGIIIAHLDYFRINEKEKGSIKPFTQDGIDALLAGPTVQAGCEGLNSL